MSYLKYSSNLFLGKQELERWWEFTVDEGYKGVFQKAIKKYGFLKIANQSFEDLKVVPGTQTDRVTIQPGTILDSNVDLITVREQLEDYFTIPNDGNTYYIVASYNTSNDEEGLVYVDNVGRITGVGTEFTKVLRGGPYHASVIEFSDAALNVGEFLVAEVVSDTFARLNIPSTTTIENDLKYRVVGTFSPGIAPPNDDKYPFNYNSYRIELTSAKPNSSQLGNTHFVLASVVNNLGNVEIVDERKDFSLELAQSTAVVDLSNHPFLGVEKATPTGEYSDLGGSFVNIGWGFRSSQGNWVYNAATNTVSINAGQGGIWNTIGGITNNLLDGWRIYFDNGRHTNIITTSNLHSQISFKVEDTSIAVDGDIVIAPPADFVLLRLSKQTTSVSDQQVLNQTFLFPNFLGTGKIFVPYVDDLVVSGFGEFTTVDAKFISGSSGQGTEYFRINNGSFLSEFNFDNNGVQTSNSFFTIVSNGGFRLNENNDAYFLSKAWLNKTNRFTAIQQWNEGATIDNATGVVDIKNDGNSFNVQIVNPEIRGIQGQENGTMIYLIPDTNVVLNPSGLTGSEPSDGFLPVATPNNLSVGVNAGEVVGFIQSNGTWKLVVVPASQQLPTSSPPIGAIMDWTGSFAGNFDASGKGVSTQLLGWALANGANGTVDARGRFIVMAIDNVPDANSNPLHAEVDPTIAGNPNYTLGFTGGEAQHTITLNEIPQHDHDFNDPGHTHIDGNFDRILQVTGQNTVDGVDNTPSPPEPDVVNSAVLPNSSTNITFNAQGGSQPHNNLPPYLVLAKIQRIF